MKTIQSGYLWVDIMVTMAIMSIYGGTVCPDVNESHYMTKAKSFWDSSYCSGDLFLESSDAHWFFFVIFGFATKFTSLAVATWIGRLICWLALAIGWCRFTRTIAPMQMIGAASIPLFLAAIHWGQLSGEWVVGGCESKCMAYAFAFLALSAAMRHDWPWTTIHFGIACAFHIVTGGWIALAMLGALAVRWIGQRTWSKMNPAPSFTSVPRSKAYVTLCTLIGAMFFTVGLVPALALNYGVDIATKEQGAIIYVFARLPHHLRVYGFTPERWQMHSLLMIATGVVAVVTWAVFRHGRLVLDGPKGQDAATPQVDYSLLFVTCAFGVVFSIIGAIIDISLSSWAINWSATLLRYYWFRWNDVAWPIALCTLVLMVVYRLQMLSYVQTWRLPAQIFYWAILLVPGCILGAQKWIAMQTNNLPPADQRSLIFAFTSPELRLSTYQDWRDVCTFVRERTDGGALWLTPRNQQTFKWYAQRAEVCCWKDSPQNAKDLVEWYRRIHRVFAADENGGPKPLNQARVVELFSEFHFDYVILDRRSDPEPLAMPILFENDTYAVFQMQFK